MFHLRPFISCTSRILHSRPLVRPSEAGRFGLVDCGGVEFAVGGVYDGFVVVYVEREMVDFFSGRSVDVALDHRVVAYFFVLVDFDAQGVGDLFRLFVYELFSICTCC